MPNPAGYRFLPITLAEYQPAPSAIVIAETLDPDQIDGAFGSLAELRRTHTTHGVVLKTGARATDLGLVPGDRVVYEAWQGGRWGFRDPESPDNECRCLIMDVSFIVLKIRRNEEPVHVNCG